MLFRVWDKKNNCYSREPIRIDREGNVFYEDLSCFSYSAPWYLSYDYEVEFNTGITLADGTETFYGDIIRWKDSMFDSKGGDGYRYWILEPERMRRLPWVWTDIVDKNCFRKDIELIGNIHETELTDAMKVWIKGE